MKKYFIGALIVAFFCFYLGYQVALNSGNNSRSTASEKNETTSPLQDRSR